MEEKIRMAYGEDCPELKFPIKLELRSKKMVLVAGGAEFDKDGRVRLDGKVSVAMFGDNKNDGKYVEINTIKGDRAWLTFDRPVYSPADINGRKITDAELVGNIDIVNNNRSKERTDDLVLHINHGPLYYKESTHLIWTEDWISVLDQRSTPKPTQIRGKGMEVELLADAPAKPGVPVRKQKQENISGVKRIIIPADVEMYLYVAANSSGMPGDDHAAQQAGDERGEIGRGEGGGRRGEGPGRYQDAGPLPLRLQQGPRPGDVRRTPRRSATLREVARGRDRRPAHAQIEYRRPPGV